MSKGKAKKKTKKKKHERKCEQRKKTNEEERREDKGGRTTNKTEGRKERGRRGRKRGEREVYLSHYEGVKDNNITPGNYCDNDHVLDYFPPAIAPWRCAYDRK